MSDDVFRRIMDYDPKAHKEKVMSSRDLGSIELAAKALRKRGVDYDYALAGERNAEGHTGDAGKLYNHPTYSNESAFANKRFPGGKWSKEKGKDVYTPSTRQVSEPGYKNKLGQYFKYEQGRGIDKIVWPK